MKSLFSFVVLLLSAVAISQKPFSNYIVTNAGKSINTENVEMFPMVLSNGLTLYFSSDRPGGQGDLDIYVCTRKSKDDAWNAPQNLGPIINTKASDHSVTVSEDGHWMIFTSEKEGGFGTGDLYLSYRKNTLDPLGWEEAKNTGKELNSTGYEGCPFFHKTNQGVKVYFASNKEGGNQFDRFDIYASYFDSGRFNTAVPVKGINSAGGEMHFEAMDGFLWTNRKGGFGGDDIWISTKRLGDNEWETPVPLDSNINTSANEGMPSMTHNKSLFVFHSDRPGGIGKLDIYFAQPTK